jgi:hypothetical protein
VPPGTGLNAYAGPCTITEDGTVIDAKTVVCPSGFTIQAANVTIKNSLIKGYVRLDPDSPAYDGTWTVTVTDSEIDAGMVQLAAICCGNMTVTRANLHNGITAAQCEELSDHCLIRDSWLHGQYLPDDQPWHLGGFLSDGTAGPACTGTWCIELIHNSVACDRPVNLVQNGCTGDINFIPNFAPIRKVRVFNNFLHASADLAYCTFGGDKVGSPHTGATDLVYQDNVFERGPTTMCGGYGAVTSFNPRNAGNAWTNNTYDDGSVIPAP